MGKFIVFEGLDGSGKSTLLEGLAYELKKNAIHSLSTREPGGTSLAESVRQLVLSKDVEAPVPIAELLLYAASRAQHVSKLIAPELKKGWVLCDRFSGSTIAFQVFGRALHRPDVEDILRVCQQGVNPDLYVLVDVTVEESARRRHERDGIHGDRMESEAKAFHQKVREGYLQQAKENPAGWLVLDGMKTRDEVKHDLLAELARRAWLKI